MGVLVLGMNFLTDIVIAVPFLILLGGLGGFLVVPMNALLQHRGHNLMGAGRSIAVQNFNEQACILLLGLMYAGLTNSGLSAYGAISAGVDAAHRPVAPSQPAAAHRRGRAPAGDRAFRSPPLRRGGPG
jgi:hypothetical protein